MFWYNMAWFGFGILMHDDYHHDYLDLKILGLGKRGCSAGVPCANFAISLFILFSAAPNLVIHYHLSSRTRDVHEMKSTVVDDEF